MTTETLPLMEGVYHKVQVGFTLTPVGPLWSVDIETTLDGPTFVGNGPTLDYAAEEAARAAATFGHVTVAVTPPELPDFGIQASTRSLPFGDEE